MVFACTWGGQLLLSLRPACHDLLSLQLVHHRATLVLMMDMLFPDRWKEGKCLLLSVLKLAVGNVFLSQSKWHYLACTSWLWDPLVLILTSLNPVFNSCRMLTQCPFRLCMYTLWFDSASGWIPAHSAHTSSHTGKSKRKKPQQNTPSSLDWKK